METERDRKRDRQTDREKGRETLRKKQRKRETVKVVGSGYKCALPAVSFPNCVFRQANG